MLYENKSKNIRIEAKDLVLGKGVTFGKDINIKVSDIALPSIFFGEEENTTSELSILLH